MNIINSFSKSNIKKYTTDKRLAPVCIWYHSVFSDFNSSHKSLELSKLFKDVCESVKQHVQNFSFCSDIFDIKGLNTTVNNIRLLKKEELEKHCREPYQWSKGLRPGDVIASEVRVTSDKSELQVILNRLDFLKSANENLFFL